MPNTFIQLSSGQGPQECRAFIPLLAGLAGGHAFIPPTPGPVLVATMLGVDLGWVILIGALCGVVAMIVAGPVWGAWCGKKYHIPAPDRIVPAGKTDKSKIPSFWTVVIIILIPLVLIILKSVAFSVIFVIIAPTGVYLVSLASLSWP